MRLLRAGALAGLIALLSACGIGPTTVPRVQTDVAATFGNGYVLQQALLGRPTIAVSQVGAVASCSRVGHPELAGGSGDWTCILQWRPVTGPGPTAGLRTGSFEVQVRPDGCWTARGPAAQVGPVELQDVDGNLLVNPVAAFDGCLTP